MLMMAEFWVTLAFVALVLVALYYKVPAMVSGKLDERADNIRKELDEARRLREEAQQLLADYKRKQGEAEQEAQEIVAQARKDAAAMADEARQSLAASLERRTRLAEEKIARAEAQAISDVRAAAVDSAINAAEKILKDKVPGATGNQMINQGIAELAGKFRQ